jgi:hypothetical protein
LPDVTAALYRASDAHLQLRVLRDGRPVNLEAHVPEPERSLDGMADAANPDKHLVRPLGIIALDIDDDVQRKLHLREARGVIVVARTLDGPSASSALLPGDAIYALNRRRVSSVEALRGAMEERSGADALVLQIERGGHFHYLVLDLE